MKDAVDNDFSFYDFKVNPVIGGAETIKGLAVMFNLSEGCSINVLESFFTNLKLLEQLKLFQCSQTGNFRRTDFIENYL